MPVDLNHTIVLAPDREAEAAFLTEILDLPVPVPYGPFLVVETANGVSLDVMTTGSAPEPQHYAFLVSEGEWDAIADRLAASGRSTWADPVHREPGHNTHDGGRGLYFDSPAGHNLEIITRPYGSGR